MSGGASVTAGALRPHSNRLGTGQAAAYWAGGAAPPIPLMQFLVIAGGGGGGPGGGGEGGGGAGGYRNSVTGELSGASSSALSPLVDIPRGTALVVTVGAGGGDTGQGSDSVFHTITSLGGGCGGYCTGGSGGGSGFPGGGPYAGTALQGTAGGVGGRGTNDPYYSFLGGGGGGAGSGGGNKSSYDPGSAGGGGSGLTSSINGTSTTRAGGGGGGADSRAYPAGGGSGGGGTGSGGSNLGYGQGTAGATNTGSGGGGGQYGLVGGKNGGSGIVIIRYLLGEGLAASVSAGLTYTTATTGIYRYYQFTSGTGTITF